MIDYNYEADFTIEDEEYYTDWICRVIKTEGASYSQLSYIFCTDDYLWKLNKRHLNHDALTDIITFDYSSGKCIAGDIFISIDRVRDNALGLNIQFSDELKRVMIHGVLHMLGYSDKTEEEVEDMRRAENEKLKLFHVEQ